ncbi:hypothetical protein TIFTF001_009968 [Ficus carica]|uniref:Protein kinase domain-containing protein n=1 Tax=Ficus carica TaxID=3494 RepID=A0AA88DHL2_FICCA|nr:hypothetical protein TIFTF001_009968 [Ficus carica]
MRPLAFEHFLLAFLVSFVLICDGQDQTGFISIDCGLEPDVTNYTEKSTGLNFISDQTFVDTGESKVIYEKNKKEYQRQYYSFRSFPEGNRNCYKIRVAAAGTKYLIRAEFFYGDYDEHDMPLTFDLYVGNDLWDSIKISNSSSYVYKEIIHVPPRNPVLVCLVNTGNGTPFITTLEFRPLDNSTYLTKGVSLATVGRWDVGSSKDQYRYDKDFHDRFWYEWQPSKTKNLSTTLAITDSKDTDDHYNIPSVVMSTAAMPQDANGSLIFRWPPDNRDISGDEYYFYMHFAEIQVLQANQTREFNIFYNGEFFDGPISPAYLQTRTVYNKIPLKARQHTFTISKAENSTLPPILNALEIYTVKQFSLWETHQQDVKSTYGLKRNWQGDPCLPKEYLWEGLNCSYKENDKPPRIIALDLSNNNFTGNVPEFLSRLEELRVLNLDNNQLNGPLPAELMAKWKKGFLQLSVNGNPNICASVSCKKKHSAVVPVVASVVGASILLLAIAAAIYCGLLRSRHGIAKAGFTIGPYSLEAGKRQFTYADIPRITNNFDRVIGKGGFGTVYHGHVGDTQVAVKMLSRSSVQGYQQFQSEARGDIQCYILYSLNLTALVGYFTDENNTGLIYEYMANSDLRSHLSAGLEYLHHGCKPPIIHRDVKSANILLDENFRAKISDFGISKIFPTSDNSVTHVSTEVAGTLGYLDPKYYKSNRLNEKSDVYSFGIVLLEIITGRPAISKIPDETCLREWVIMMFEKGLINGIVDPRLQGNFHVNSAWKAVEIALNCVSLNSAKRPTMSEVIGVLKGCLEATKVGCGSENKSKDSIQAIPLNLVTQEIDTQPSAR